ncbi:MAG TPA: hypothetical protein VIX85_02910 [Acidimicrobiales bacterium]
MRISQDVRDYAIANTLNMVEARSGGMAKKSTESRHSDADVDGGGGQSSDEGDS